MPNADHYAIVVGLTRYPGLGEPPESAANLKGPGNDADAIAAWLTSKSGGDLPDSNVTVIKSPELDPTLPPIDAKPTRDEIERAFIALDTMGQGGKVGRRLYVYMSGHGFSPKRNHGCLFAANATARIGAHVYPSSWIEWFQDAAYFDEHVLWMDCCMNRLSTLALSLAPAKVLNRPTVAGPAFIAFAAQRPLKAAEREFPEDNKVHGIFTQTLLEGLQGAAANGYGMVTGHSLGNWLRNAQRPRMSQRDLDDPEVAEEPEISREDPGLVFVRGIAAKTYKVRLSFPAVARGQHARLWSGRPPRVDTFGIDGGSKELLLPPGLYVLDVPGTGLRQGFEVTSELDVDISATDNAIADGAAKVFELEIAPDNNSTEIFIIDERFGLVDRNPGSLRSRLPFGIYKIKSRVARTVREHIILLDHDLTAVRPQPVQVASAAPLPNTALTHEYHIQAATRPLAATHVNAGKGARLSIMARAWSETGQTRSDLPPWAGVRVVNARGTLIADLSRDGERHTDDDPVAVCSLSVDPGTYFLRHRLEGGTEVEQSLIVPKGWFLHAYLLRLTNPGGVGFKITPRLSFVMHRAGVRSVDFDDPLLRTLETARVALADERRRILSKELELLLLQKFDNPIAGMIGGHLVLIENERDPNRDVSILNEVVRNLRRLVGAGHPDVEALSLRCPDASLRCASPVKSPPMFQRSWTLLFEGSQKQPSLLPRRLWSRVQALSTLPPYLVWAVDEESKEAAHEALVGTIVSMALPGLEYGFELTVPGASALTNLEKKPASTPQFKELSRRILDTAGRNAVRLQLPPSAVNQVSRSIIDKLKG